MRGVSAPPLATYHLLFVLPITNVREVARDGGGGGHRRADEVRAPAAPLPALEVAVARGGATLAGPQDVGVHAEAHRAARLAPLEAGFAEDAVQPLGFRRTLDGLRAGHDHRAHAAFNPVPFQNPRRGAQVFYARVGAGADEDAVNAYLFDGRARAEAHVTKRAVESECVRLARGLGGRGHAPRHGGDHAGARPPG